MGTIATTKNRMAPQAFTGRWSFWNRSHSRNTKATNARKTYIIRQESVQTEPQPGEYLNGKEYFLKTACIGAHRHAETAVFHSGKRFFPPLQVGTNCHAGIDQHHSEKGVAE